MKVCKIKNLDKGIVDELISLIDENWIGEINYPNVNSYVIIEDNKVIPAYINVKDNEALILWVHKSCRRKGYASFFVKSLNIKYITAHYSSVPFWKSLGFQHKGNSQFQKKNLRLLV